jgi:plasmid stabilization system protein ParE
VAVANVYFHPAARADYRQALAAYAGRGVLVAARFESAVEAALHRIGDTPELWGLVDDRHRVYTLRRYPYNIVYRLIGGDVEVVAIVHARRSASYWQGRG